MIIGSLLRALGYGLDLAAYVLVLLLGLEWLVHILPGAGLNPVRRALFKACYPFLQFSDRVLPMSGPLNSRGLLLALVFWGMTKSLVPWVIWSGFALKG